VQTLPVGHFIPSLHAGVEPEVPQYWLFVWGLMHVLLQLTKPAVQVSAHAPPLQRKPVPKPCVVLVQSDP
jgi:hypothetical protein